LALQRTYNSNSSQIGPFGIGWTHAYDILMEEAQGTDQTDYDPAAPNAEGDTNYSTRQDFFGHKHKYYQPVSALYRKIYHSAPEEPMMNDQEKKTLIDGMFARSQHSVDIHRRLHDHLAKWDAWQAEIARAKNANEAVPPLWEDETHLALIAERQQITQDLQTQLRNRPPVGSEAKSLAGQLSPEEKKEFSRRVYEHLHSLPPELLSSINSGIERAKGFMAEKTGNKSNADIDASSVQVHRDVE
jgi:hypothetical protein